MLGDRLLVLAEQRVERSSDEQRGVGGDKDAHEDRQRDVGQRRRPQPESADEEDRADRKRRDDRGVDRPHERLVHREVHRFPERPRRMLALFCRVLPDLVEHDGGVVERIREDGEEADHRRRRDLEPGQRIHAYGDHEHVEQTEDRGCRHLPGAEVEREDEEGQRKEDRQAPQGLAGDALSPAGTDVGRADGLGLDAICLGEGGGDLPGLRVRHLVGLHADVPASDGGDLGRCARDDRSHRLAGEAL
ncbi:hypothetical protein ABE10_02375, partial [Bacillus toyonensis]|nr:hypothetical protein [Bacillus toyonensis]